MKKHLLFLSCLLLMLIPTSVFAANVTKVVITVVEPVVGEKNSFKASVPPTASTEVYEVHWTGEFDNGRFIQGNNYTMTVKLKIKDGSSNVFAAPSKIKATINGKQATYKGMQAYEGKNYARFDLPFGKELVAPANLTVTKIEGTHTHA